MSHGDGIIIAYIERVNQANAANFLKAAAVQYTQATEFDDKIPALTSLFSCDIPIMATYSFLLGDKFYAYFIGLIDEFLTEYPKLFPTGLVIAVMSNRDVDLISELMRVYSDTAASRTVFMDARGGKTLEAELAEVSSRRKIGVVITGTLPKSVYESFVERTALPFVFEGANGYNLSKVLQKTFLRVANDQDALGQVPEQNHPILTAASRIAYAEADAKAPFKSFLADTQDPNTALSVWLRDALHHNYSDKHDKVSMAVDYIVGDQVACGAKP